MSANMRDVQLHNVKNLKGMEVEDQSPYLNANFKVLADELARINRDIKKVTTYIETLNSGFGKVSKYLNNQ